MHVVQACGASSGQNRLHCKNHLLLAANAPGEKAGQCQHVCSRSESGAARGAHASTSPRVLLQPLGKLSATPVTLNACTESERSILVRAKKDCLASPADAIELEPARSGASTRASQ